MSSCRSVHRTQLYHVCLFRSTKKGKAGKPGGATAAAAAKFSTPRSGRSTVTPTANPDIDATAPQDVQGVYTQSFGGIELDDPFSINNERAQLASQSTLADNIAIMPAKVAVQCATVQPLAHITHHTTDASTRSCECCGYPCISC